MRVGKIFIFLFFILLTTIVSAEELYPSPGGPNDNFYTNTTGIFNSELTTEQQLSVRAVTDVTGIPLVGDLDKDGTNEIIHIDAGSVILRQGQTMTVVDSFATGTDTSNGEIFDIEEDGDDEYIFFDETNGLINIMDFDGENFTNTTTYDVSGYNNFISGGMSILKCAKKEECLLLHSDGYSTFNILGFIMFNTTEISPNSVAMVQSDASSTRWCFPADHDMYYGDLDKDGTEEYVFSAIGTTTASKYDQYIVIAEINKTHLLDSTEIERTSTGGYGTGTCEQTLAPYKMSSPLVMDVLNGGDLEIVVALQRGLGNFYMEAFKTDGTSYDEFPEVLSVNGIAVSNVIRGHYFIDSPSFSPSQGKDFCTMVTSNTAQKLVIICGSKERQIFLVPESDFFNYTTTTNLTVSGQKYNFLIHRINFASDLQTSQDFTANLDEILTPYGVFTTGFQTDGCTGGIQSCNLLKEYDAPILDSAVLPVDYLDEGRSYLLFQGDTSIALYGDGFTNTLPYFENVRQNPCSPVQINSTLDFEVTVSDLNTDNLVRSRVAIYQGDTNLMVSDWSPFVARGTAITHTFVVNKTAPVVNYVIYATDDDQNTTNVTITGNFAVQTQGFEWGESVCDIYSDSDGDGVPDSDEGDGGAGSGTDTDNNTVVNILNPIADSTGLGVSVLYIVCIFILLFMFGWQLKDVFESHPRMMMGFLTFLGILALIVGVKLNLISTGIIVTISVLSVIALGVIGWKSFQPHNM